MKISNLNYNVIFTPEPEGGFTVTVPCLPGLVTYGKNLKEAKEMAQKAIDLFIETLRDHKLPIPTDNSFITAMGATTKTLFKAKQKNRVYA